jgi:hypothetical protein
MAEGFQFMKTPFLFRAFVSLSFTMLVPIVCFFHSCSLSAGQHDHALVRIHGMHEIRASHTATALPDGKVLIAGGFRKGPDGHSQIYSLTAELFDPKTERFVWTGKMNVRRAGHTATLLQNGKVLIAGGFSENGLLASAELYDPLTYTFSPVGSMSIARGGSTATLLSNGDVLVAGGGDVTASASAELFHPATNQFSPTGAMTTPRLAHTATLLPDGKVLILGGGSGQTVLSSAELYDPAKGTFRPAGAMKLPRYKHAAILLKDGHTLILGGSDGKDWRGTYNSAEIYDWKSERFTPIPAMASQRFKFAGAVVQIASGNILICGGCRTIELFDFLMKHFRTTADLDQAYYYGTASLLNNGAVLIVGGYTDSIQSTDAAWIYKE